MATLDPALRRLIPVAFVCALLSGVAWMLYGILLERAPAQDFMVFHTAARAWIEGERSLLYDGQAFTAHLNAQFADRLAQPLTLHPWVYPPTFLFVVVPLGMLPFVPSCALFLATGFIGLNLALRCYTRAGIQRRLCFVSLLLAPATVFTIAVGQNAFLAAALMVGGFGLLARSPLLGGCLLGLLTFKPQLWLLVPVALVAARQWRGLAAALVTASCLALASAAVFGIEPWRHWIGLMAGGDPQFQDWMLAGRLYGQSLFAVATLLGASPAVAKMAQLAAVATGALLVWRSWRAADAPADMKLCILLAATIIAAPHVSNYDAVMLAVAVTLLLCRALDEGLRPAETGLIVVAWGIELLNPPKAIPLGLVTPLVLMAVIAVMFRHSRPDMSRRPLHGVPAG